MANNMLTKESTIKNRDSDLVYIGALICQEIEDMENYLFEFLIKNPIFEGKINHLFFLKEKFKTILLKENKAAS